MQTRADERVGRRRAVRRGRRRLLPRRCRAPSPARSPGDVVKVWFDGRAAQTSDSFTYTAKVEPANRVLVVSAEDYTGHLAGLQEDPRPDVPVVLPRRAGRERDPAPTSTTSTRTAARRRAPSACSRTTTLSSGTRATTSSRASRDGRRHRVAARERRAARRPGVPQRGRPAALHGQVRRAAVRPGLRVTTSSTNAAVRSATSTRRRLHRARRTTSSSTTSARTSTTRTPGRPPNGQALRRRRRRQPVHRPLAGRSAARSANNQDHSASFIATSGILPASHVPAVRQLAVGEVRPAGRAVRPAHRRRATRTRRSRTCRTSA